MATLDDKERSEKLLAGREKLAAFQKRRVKKKRKHEHKESKDHSQQAHEVNIPSDQSDIQSLTYESDQGSVDDYDDEPNVAPVTTQTETVFNQLRLATERATSLEETISGKNSLIINLQKENEQLRARLNTRSQGGPETTNGKAGSDLDIKLEDLYQQLLEKDSIISELSAKLDAVTENRTTLQAEYTKQAEQMAAQIKALQAQVQEAGSLLKSQAGGHDLSTRALMEAQSEILALRELLLERENEINTLQRVSRVSASEKQELSAQLDKLQKELSAYRVQNSNLQQQILSASLQPQQQYELSQVENNLREAIEEKYMLMRDIQELKDTCVHIESAQSECEVFRTANQELQSKIAQMVNQRETSDSEVKHLQNKVKELVESNSKQEQVLSTYYSSKAEAELSEVNSELAGAKEEIRRLTEQLRDSQAQFGQLQAKADLISEMIKTQPDQGFNEEMVKNMIQELEHKFSEEISVLKDSNKKYVEQMQQQHFKQKLDLQEKYATQLAKEKEMYTERMTALQERIKDLELGGLEADSKLAELNTSSQEENAAVIKKVDQLVAEKESLLQDLAKVNHTHEVAVQQLKEMASELTKTKQEKDMVNSQLKELQGQYSDIVAGMNELKELSDRLIVERDSNTQEKGKLQSEHEQLKKHLSAVESQLNETKEENEKLNIELKRSQTDLSEVQDQLDRSIADITEAQASKEVIQAELKDALVNVEGYKKETEMYISQIKEHNAAGEELRMQLHDAVEIKKQMEEEMMKLNTRINDLEGQKQTVSDELEKLLSQEERSTAELSESQTDLAKATELIEQLKQQMQEQAEEKAGLEKKVTAEIENMNRSYQAEQKSVLEEAENNLQKEVEKFNEHVKQHTEDLAKKDETIELQASKYESLLADKEKLLEERDARLNEHVLKIQTMETNKNSELAEREKILKDEVNRLELRSAEQQELLRERDKTLQDRDVKLNEQLEKHETETNEKDAKIVELEKALSSLTTQVQQKDSSLEETKHQVENLEKKHSGEITERDAKVTELERTISNLTEQLKDKGSTIEETILSLESLNAKYTSEIAEKETNVTELENKLSDLKLQLQQKESSLDETTQKMENLKEKFARELSEKESECTVLENKVSELILQIQQNDTQVAETSSRLETLDEKYAKELAEKDRVLETKVSEIEALAADKGRLLEDIDGLTKEHADKLASLEVTFNKQLSEERNTSEAKVQDLELQVANISKLLVEKETTVTEQSSHLSNILESHSKELCDKEQTHEAETSALQSQISQISTERDAALQEKGALVEELTENHEKVLKEKDHQLKEQEDKITELSHENSQLLEKFDKQKCELEEKLSTLTESQSQAIVEKETCVKELETKLLSQTEDNRIFRKSLENKELELQDKVSSIENLEEKIVKMQSQHDEILKTLENNLSETVAHHATLIETNEQTLQDLQKKHQSLLEERENQIMIHEKEKKQHAEVLAGKDLVIKELENWHTEHNEQHRSMLEEYQKTLAGKDNIITEKLEMVTELEQKVAALSEEARSSVTEHQRAVDKLNTEHSALLNGYTTKVDELEKQIHDKNAALENLTQTSQDQDGKVSQLEQQLAELTAEVQHLRDNVMEKDNRLKENDVLVAELQEKLSDMKNSSEGHIEMMNKLQLELSEVKKESELQKGEQELTVHQIEGKLKAVQEERDSLKECYNHDVQALQDAINEMIKEKENLTKEHAEKLAAVKAEQDEENDRYKQKWETDQENFKMQIANLAAERDSIKTQYEQAVPAVQQQLQAHYEQYVQQIQQQHQQLLQSEVAAKEVLHQELTVKDASMEELKSQLASTQEQINAEVAAKEAVTNMLQEKESAICQLQSDLRAREEQLKEELSDKEAAASETKEKDSVIENLKVEFETLQQKQNTDLSAAQEQLNSELSRIKALNKELELRESTIDELKTNLAEMQTQLTAEIISKESVVQSLEDKNKQYLLLQSDLTAVHNELEQEKASHAETMQTIQTKVSALKDLQGLLDQTQQQLKSEISAREAANTAREENSRTLEKLQLQLTSVQSEFAQSVQQRNAQETNLTELQSQLETLTSQFEEKSAEVLRLKSFDEGMNILKQVDQDVLCAEQVQASGEYVPIDTVEIEAVSDIKVKSAVMLHADGNLPDDEEEDQLNEDAVDGADVIPTEVPAECKDSGIVDSESPEVLNEKIKHLQEELDFVEESMNERHEMDLVRLESEFKIDMKEALANQKKSLEHEFDRQLKAFKKEQEVRFIQEVQHLRQEMLSGQQVSVTSFWSTSPGQLAEASRDELLQECKELDSGDQQGEEAARPAASGLTDGLTDGLTAHTMADQDLIQRLDGLLSQLPQEHQDDVQHLRTLLQQHLDNLQETTVKQQEEMQLQMEAQRITLTQVHACQLKLMEVELKEQNKQALDNLAAAMETKHRQRLDQSEQGWLDHLTRFKEEQTKQVEASKDISSSGVTEGCLIQLSDTTQDVTKLGDTSTQQQLVPNGPVVPPLDLGFDYEESVEDSDEEASPVNDTNTAVIDLENKIKDLQKEIENLKENHRDEIKILREGHTIELDEISSHHAAEVERLKSVHSTNIEDLQSSHKTEINNALFEQELQLQEMKEELGQVQERHAAHVDTINRSHDQEIQEMQRQLSEALASSQETLQLEQDEASTECNDEEEEIVDSAEKDVCDKTLEDAKVRMQEIQEEWLEKYKKASARVAELEQEKEEELKEVKKDLEDLHLEELQKLKLDLEEKYQKILLEKENEIHELEHKVSQYSTPKRSKHKTDETSDYVDEDDDVTSSETGAECGAVQEEEDSLKERYESKMAELEAQNSTEIQKLRISLEEKYHQELKSKEKEMKELENKLTEALSKSTSEPQEPTQIEAEVPELDQETSNELRDNGTNEDSDKNIADLNTEWSERYDKALAKMAGIESEHKEEIAKMKIDAQDNFIRELDLKEEEHATEIQILREKLDTRHQEELNNMKNEMMRKYEMALETLKEEQKMDIENKESKLKQVFEEQMAHLHTEFVVQNAQTQVEQKENMRLQIEQELTEKHKEQEAGLLKKIDTLQKEIEDLINDSEEKSRKHKKELDNMYYQLRTVEEEYEKYKIAVRSGEAADVQSLKQKMRENMDEDLEFAKSLMEQEYQEFMQGAEETIREEIEAEKEELIEKHESELKQLKEEREKQISEMEKKHQENMAAQEESILKEKENFRTSAGTSDAESPTRKELSLGENDMEKSDASDKISGFDYQTTDEEEDADDMDDDDAHPVGADMGFGGDTIFFEPSMTDATDQDVSELTDAVSSEMVKSAEPLEQSNEDYLNELQELKVAMELERAKHSAEMEGLLRKHENHLESLQVSQDDEVEAARLLVKEELLQSNLKELETMTSEMEQAHQSELDSIQQQYSEQITALQQALENKELELQQRIQELEELHQHDMQQLQTDIEGKLQKAVQQAKQEDLQQQQQPEAAATDVAESQQQELKDLKEAMNKQLMNDKELWEQEQAAEIHQKYEGRIKDAETAREAADRENEELKSQLEEMEQRNKIQMQELDQEFKDRLEEVEKHHTEELEKARNHYEKSVDARLNEQKEVLEAQRQAEIQAVREALQQQADQSETEEELEQLKAVLTERDSQMTEMRAEADHKEHLITELNEKISSLMEQTRTDTERQDLVATRRQREREEENNLLSILRTDLERMNNERDDIAKTNEGLLRVMSELVKVNMAAEQNINRRLARLNNPRRTSSTPTQDSPPSGPGDRSVARRGEGADASVAEQTTVNLSAYSMLSDEGLDLSQGLCESMFVGPELEPDGEEVVLDVGNRLQFAVERLLDIVTESSEQIQEAHRRQRELNSQVETKGSDNDELQQKCGDLEQRLQDEVNAREYLALELNKAEGLLSGYATEKQQLSTNIQSLEEKRELLIVELEHTKKRLQEYMESQEELQAREEDLQRQRQVLSGNLHDEAQGHSTVTMETSKPEEGLLEENSRVQEEKRELQKQHDDEKVALIEQLQNLEGRLEDIVAQSELDLERKEVVIQDLQQQVDTLEKQLRSNKQFLEEQTVEREQEREYFQLELSKLNQTVKEKERQENADLRRQREYQDLEDQLRFRIDANSELILQKEQLQRDLSGQHHKVEELNEIIKQLEDDCDRKTKAEAAAMKRLDSVELELNMRQSQSGSPMMAADNSGLKHDLQRTIRDLESQLETVQRNEQAVRQKLREFEEEMKRQTSLKDELEQQMKKQQTVEEELTREREQLQLQVEDQLRQISGLRAQLDDYKLSGHAQDMHADLVKELRQQLEQEREAYEIKEKEIRDLEAQLEQVHEQMKDKEEECQQMAAQLQVADQERQHKLVALTEELSKLKEEKKKLLMERGLAGQQEDELNELKHVLGLRDNTISKLTGQIDNFHLEISTLHSQQDKLQNDLDLAEGAVNEKQLTIKELEKKLHDQQLLAGNNNKLEETLKDLQQQYAVVQGDLETAQALLNEKLQEIEQLTEQLKKQAKMAQDLAQQEQKIQNMQQQYTNMQDKFKGDLDTAQCKVKDKQKEIERLTQQLIEHHRESGDNSQLEQMIFDLQQQIKERDITIEENVKVIEDKDKVIEDNFKMIEDNVKIIEEKEIALKEKNGVIKEKDNIIEEKKKVIEYSDKVIEDKNNILEERDKIIQEKDRTIEEKEDVLNSKIKMLEERDKVISDKNKLITEKDSILEQKDKIIQEKDQLLLQRDNDLAAMTEKMQQLGEHVKDYESLKLRLDIVTAENKHKDDLIVGQAQEIAAAQRATEQGSGEAGHSIKLHTGSTDYDAQLSSIKEHLEQTYSQQMGNLQANHEQQLTNLQQELELDKSRALDELKLQLIRTHTDEINRLCQRHEAEMKRMVELAGRGDTTSLVQDVKHLNTMLEELDEADRLMQDRLMAEGAPSDPTERMDLDITDASQVDRTEKLEIQDLARKVREESHQILLLSERMPHRTDPDSGVPSATLDTMGSSAWEEDHGLPTSSDNLHSLLLESQRAASVSRESQASSRVLQLEQQLQQQRERSSQRENDLQERVEQLEDSLVREREVADDLKRSLLKLQESLREEQHKVTELIKLKQNQAVEKKHAAEIIQKLKQELQNEVDRRLEAENCLQTEHSQVTSLRMELNLERESCREAEVKVADLKAQLDIVKASREELKSALQREKELEEQLHESLKEEREKSVREKAMVTELQAMLDLERSRTLELTAALERERRKVSTVKAALDTTKDGSSAELQHQQALCRQMKKNIEMLQARNQDLAQQVDEAQERALSSSAHKDELLSRLTSQRDDVVARLTAEKEELSGQNKELASRLAYSDDRNKARSPEYLQSNEAGQQMQESKNERMQHQIQRLYAKYMRAESFRKALVHQKKYLLVLLHGFQETERQTLATLNKMRGSNSPVTVPHHKYTQPLNKFRTAATVIVAITRLKCLVKKWHAVQTDPLPANSSRTGGSHTSSTHYLRMLPRTRSKHTSGPPVNGVSSMHRQGDGAHDRTLLRPRSADRPNRPLSGTSRPLLRSVENMSQPLPDRSSNGYLHHISSRPTGGLQENGSSSLSSRYSNGRRSIDPDDDYMQQIQSFQARLDAVRYGKK